MKKFLTLLKWEIHSAFRQRSTVSISIAFFVITLAFFPFGLEHDKEILPRVGVGLVWVTALFSSYLSIHSLFTEDYHRGVLENNYLQSLSPSSMVITKALTHWCCAGLPLTLLSPLSIPLFYMDNTITSALLLSLLVGTLIFSFIGTFTATLTLGMRHTGMIGLVISIPFTVPCLVFGAQVTLHFTPQALFGLFGFALFIIPLTIMAGSYALRIAIEER